MVKVKKFEIPFNFDIELLNFLDDNIDKNWIEFLFLSMFKEDSINARNHVENVSVNGWTYKVPETRNEYAKYIEEIQVRGYSPAILIQDCNPIKKEILDYYFKLGISNFIVTNDNIALYIKKKETKKCYCFF